MSNALPVGTVSITGLAAQGQCLLASHTLQDADGLGTLTYQWYVNGVSTTIGYRSEYYVIQQSDVGKTIAVKASYTDGAGNPQAVWSPGTAPVLNVNDSPDLTNLTLPGSVRTDLGDMDHVRCSLIQMDGKIVVAGSSGLNCALVRYMSDGSLDTSFDGDGKLLLSGAYSGAVQSIAQLPDGKLLMGGVRTATIGTTSSTSLQFFRLNVDGSVDPTYGLNGQVTLAGYQYVLSAALQPDGALFVGANINTTTNGLIKLTASGTIDETFGAKGVLEPSGRTGFVVLPDQSILAGKLVDGDSNQGYHFTVSKYDANGVVDTSLTVDEITKTVLIQFLNSLGTQVVKSTDGNAALSARFGVFGDDVNFVVQRWLWPSLEVFQLKQESSHSVTGFLPPTVGASADIFRDKSFGIDGYAVGDISRFDMPRSLAIQSDGKLVVSGDVLSSQTDSFKLNYYTDTGSWGATSSGGSYEFGVMRFNADGSIDTSFGISSASDSVVSYQEGDPPVTLNARVSVSDLDAQAKGDYSGCTLTLQRQGRASKKDVFTLLTERTALALSSNNELTHQGQVIGSATSQAGLWTIHFNGAGATEQVVNQVLQRIQYQNISGTPPASLKIDWAFSDGDATATGLSQLVLTNVLDAKSSLDRVAIRKWSDQSSLVDFSLVEGVPVKTAPTDRAHAGVSLTDVLGTLKIYLGKTVANPSPFNVLAADFNADGVVSLSDVLLLLKYYLGKETGGIRPEWAFVNVNAVMERANHQIILGVNGEELSKTNTVTSLPDVDTSTDVTLELIGVLRGDVDGSWTGT